MIYDDKIQKFKKNLEKKSLCNFGWPWIRCKLQISDFFEKMGVIPGKKGGIKRGGEGFGPDSGSKGVIPKRGWVMVILQKMENLRKKKFVQLRLAMDPLQVANCPKIYKFQDPMHKLQKLRNIHFRIYLVSWR